MTNTDYFHDTRRARKIIRYKTKSRPVSHVTPEDRQLSELLIHIAVDP